MPTTTPAEITPEIAGFVAGFTAEEPVYVPVVNTMTPLECFDNCKTTVTASGGRVVLGWAIWQREGAFVEAEHHAVVEQPDGTLIDVTPHDGESHILFVADPNATYNGKAARSNHRLALSDDPKVVEYIGIADKVSASTRRVMMYGVESLSNNQRKDGMALASRFVSIQQYIDATYAGESVYTKP